MQGIAPKLFKLPPRFQIQIAGSMNTSDLKLELFRTIDQLPEELLPALKEAVLRIGKYQTGTPNDYKKRQFGSMKGLVLYMAPDFNAPLEDFNEYMSE
jgi:hypothetical protein